MHKIYSCPSLLPPSILQTIPPNAPLPGSTHETCSQWLQIYSNTFSNSLFFKGPLFHCDMSHDLYNHDTVTITKNSHKNIIKSHLLTLQKTGDSENWTNDNFKLYNSPGLRKSTRSRNKLMHRPYNSTV